MSNSGVQNFYCEIDIDGHKIIPQNVISCVIREWIFEILPRFEMTLYDDGYLSEVFPILDDSIMTISIGVTPDDENINTMEFDIIDKSFDNIESNNSQIVSLTGVLKTNNCFFPIKNKSYKNKSSLEVLSLIGKEIGLTVVEGLGLHTTDMMTWYQIDQTNYQFIRHVLSKSYIPNDILFCYADVNNNFNLNGFKQVIEADSIPARYNTTNFTTYTLESDLERNTIWYNSFNVVNYTNTFNKLYGYGYGGSFYNFSNTQQISKKENYFPFTENSFNLKPGNIVRKEEFPIFSKNTYQDYFKSKLQNAYMKNLFNFSVLLDINAMINVKLLDKVDLVLESLIGYEKDEVNSGEYIVGGIIHTFGNSSLYKKQISLHRNGYNNPREF
jgi:hypothetical protein